MRSYLFGVISIAAAIFSGSSFSEVKQPSTGPTLYYFQVMSSTVWGSESSAALAQITTPPPSGQNFIWGCNAFSVHLCTLGFTGYYQDPISSICYPASSTGRCFDPILIVGPASYSARIGKF